jgi:hypothetical protein
MSLNSKCGLLKNTSVPTIMMLLLLVVGTKTMMTMNIITGIIILKSGMTKKVGKINMKVKYTVSLLLTSKDLKIMEITVQFVHLFSTMLINLRNSLKSLLNIGTTITV